MVEKILGKHERKELIVKQPKEKIIKEKQIKEKQIKEKQIKEKQIKEKQIKEKQIKEKSNLLSNEYFQNSLKDFNPIIKGKRIVQINNTQFVWCGERLSANKKWGDDSILVIQYGNDLLTISQKEYLESGPLETNTWKTTGGYSGGMLNSKLLSKMKPLNELLKDNSK